MDYSATYDPDTDFDARYTLATGRAIGAWVRPGDRVLELGCATGLMTTQFAAAGARVTAVDRFGSYLDRLAARALPGVVAVEADLTEAWDLDDGYQHVVATSLLHEVPDPGGFLAAAAGRLAPGGLLHVSVPNPRSLHRLVAVEMGLLDDVGALSDRARSYEMRRVLDPEALGALAGAAGLRVVHREGVMLKPLPNDQMAALPADVLDGFERAARLLPDHGAMSLYVLR